MSDTGILGGTFDPVHNGHLWLARAAMEGLSLSRVIWIPASAPPHKAPSRASASRRLSMLRLALSGLPRMEICGAELNRPGKSYTADTLAMLKRERPDENLFLLCGADMFLTVQDWRDSDRIFSLCTVVANAREGGQYQALAAHAAFLKGRFNAKTCLLKENPLVISSTDVRKRIASGKTTEGLIPGAVRDYIDRSGLYRE